MITITEVQNVITGAKETYTNQLDTEENLITSILILEGKGSQLHNEAQRNEARQQTEKIYSKNGSYFHYCQKHDLVSKTLIQI